MTLEILGGLGGLGGPKVEIECTTTKYLVLYVPKMINTFHLISLLPVTSLLSPAIECDYSVLLYKMRSLCS